MRLVAVAALAAALSGCGGGDGGELAAGSSRLNEAQIDAALGPADQTRVQDAIPAEKAQNELDLTANDLALEANAAGAQDEDEQ